MATRATSNLEQDPIDKSAYLQSVKGQTVTQVREGIQRTSVVVMYSAAAVGSSVALLLVPNLETITLVVFLVSYMHGLRTGFATMLTTAIIFELFASMIYGVAGYLLPFKVLAYTLTVLVAVSLRSSNVDFGTLQFGRPLLFSIGVFVTLIFDLSTSIGFLFVVQDLGQFFVFFLSGIPWIVFHQLCNGTLFTLIPSLSRDGRRDVIP